MGNWEKQQGEKREGKERDKTRRETLAKYLYDLSKLSFAGLVVGGIAPVFTNISQANNWYNIITGIMATFILAWMGNRILK